MGTFFHGWRRKLGVMTLVMACVFVVGWVRSRTFYDTVSRNDPRFRYVTKSFDGRIQFDRITSIYKLPSFSRDSGKLYDMFEFQLDDDGIQRPFNPWKGTNVIWKTGCLGFHAGAGTSDLNFYGKPDIQIVTCIIPYWSVVTPLTLLATYLLLTKERQPSQKKLIEPNNTVGD